MRILKTEVPVGAPWADYEMGDIVHVGHQRHAHVTVWWWDGVRGARVPVLPQRRLRVFATGEEVYGLDSKGGQMVSPKHLGTVVDLGTKTVWHLLEDVL